MSLSKITRVAQHSSRFDPLWRQFSLFGGSFDGQARTMIYTAAGQVVFRFAPNFASAIIRCEMPWFSFQALWLESDGLDFMNSRALLQASAPHGVSSQASINVTLSSREFSPSMNTSLPRACSSSPLPALGATQHGRASTAYPAARRCRASAPSQSVNPRSRSRFT